MMETAVLSEHVRKRAIDDATARLTQRGDDAAAIERELRDLQRRGERLAEQIEKGNADSTFLVAGLRKIETAIAQGNAQMKALASMGPPDAGPSSTDGSVR